MKGKATAIPTERMERKRRTIKYISYTHKHARALAGPALTDHFCDVVVDCVNVFCHDLTNSLTGSLI